MGNFKTIITAKKEVMRTEAEPILEKEADVDKLNTLLLIHKCFYEIASEMTPDPNGYFKILVKLQKMGFKFSDILLWQEYQEAIILSDIINLSL